MLYESRTITRNSSSKCVQYETKLSKLPPISAPGKIARIRELTVRRRLCAKRPATDLSKSISYQAVLAYVTPCEPSPFQSVPGTCSSSTRVHELVHKRFCASESAVADTDWLRKLTMGAEKTSRRAGINHRGCFRKI